MYPEGDDVASVTVVSEVKSKTKDVVGKLVSEIFLTI